MATQLITNLLHKQGFENIKSLNFQDFSGYNCGSINKTVQVTFTDDKKDLHLFLKICPKDSFIKTVDSKIQICDKEISFYTKLLPGLIKFQRENVSHELKHSVINLFFKCFGSETIDEDVYIVLEKFSDDCYFSTPKEAFHTKDQITSAIHSIATLHAVSYCMKVKENVDFLTTYPILQDRLFDPNSQCDVIANFYSGSYRNNLRIIKAFSTYNADLPSDYDDIGMVDVKEIKRLEDLSEKIMKIFHHMCNFSDESAVLCHGDFHMGNIAFSKKETEKDLKLFDFQLIRFASGLTDVHQYLFQVCTPQERDVHLQDYLRTYCNSFKSTCSELGLPEEKNIFDIDYITMEYQRTSPWGFLFGFMFLMYRFVPNEIYAKATSTDDMEEIVKLLKDVDSFSSIYRIYVDLVHEAKSAGVLDLMVKYTFSA